MMKLVFAGSAALMLGLASAHSAPIPAPALGQAIDSQTTRAMMEQRTMHRGYMHRRYGMHHRGYGMHRGMMMRRHHMHGRMMHRM